MLDVDPTRFAQVISNLLQNAVKFTPPGGRITIQGLSLIHISEPTRPY